MISWCLLPTCEKSCEFTLFLNCKHVLNKSHDMVSRLIWYVYNGLKILLIQGRLLELDNEWEESDILRLQIGFWHLNN
jgi:hypothetical protein